MSSTNRFPERMTAIEIARPGGPEVLVATSRPLPTPGPREVLVEVRAAGVNGPDALQRKGVYDPPPGASDIPGLEIAGTVRAVGSEVSRFAVGEAVMALIPGGGYAQFAVADERTTPHLPDGLGMEEAAALPETFMTVWVNLFQRGGFKAGETLLVHGGASGIGTAATMLGRPSARRRSSPRSPARPSARPACASALTWRSTTPSRISSRKCCAAPKVAGSM